MASGLKECGILQSIQAFPSLYIPMFMHTGDMSSSEVLKAITFTEDSESEMVLAHLNRFIMESNNKRMFLCMCKCGTCSHLMCDPFWENRPYCLGQNIFGIQVNHFVYYSYSMAKTAMVVTFWHF